MARDGEEVMVEREPTTKAFFCRSEKGRRSCQLKKTEKTKGGRRCELNVLGRKAAVGGSSRAWI